MTHKEWIRRCIEECKTCGNLNTASGAERLVEKLAERMDEAMPKNGVYELIEEITLANDEQFVIRTTEPDGTPYNFERVFIVANVMPGSALGSVTCAINTDPNGTNYDTTILSTDAFSGIGSSMYIWSAECKPEGGCLRWMWTNNVGSFTDALIPRMSQNPLKKILAGNITYVKVGATSSSKIFPSGSMFKIYGVRA